MADSSSAVAIAVVSTNQRELLANALASMKPDADAGLAEVWVVDNASNDGSPEMVRDVFEWVKLIASDVNLGYGRAINRVAEQTSTPWVAPANEDIELRPGALAQLLKSGGEHPEAAIVAPRLELPDGSTQHSVHSFPTFGFSLFFNLGLHRVIPGAADRLCIEGSWDSSRPREVPWAIATFMLVRRDAFDAAGGFADDQFIHSEDLDLCWRLDRAGWKVRFDPVATVFHVGSAATKQAFGDDLWPRYMAASYSWIARRRGLLRERATAIANIAGAGLRYVLASGAVLIAPKRFGPVRDSAKRWLGIHRVGLRSRRELLREH